LFYSLKSGKIIKSDRWISLSHTPESLFAINALAREATTTDPVFEFYSEIIDDTPAHDSEPAAEQIQSPQQQYNVVMNLQPPPPPDQRALNPPSIAPQNLHAPINSTPAAIDPTSSPLISSSSSSPSTSPDQMVSAP
jgi:hypothetical protein